jgi:hypothetical protein
MVLRIVRDARQYADTAHAIRLLCTRSERPCCRATQNTEKIPPSHARPLAPDETS